MDVRFHLIALAIKHLWGLGRPAPMVYLSHWLRGTKNLHASIRPTVGEPK